MTGLGLSKKIGGNGEMLVQVLRGMSLVPFFLTSDHAEYDC